MEYINLTKPCNFYFKYYYSTFIIRIIKSRRMRWAGDVARMMPVGYWWESQRERHH
jgi:hypothetical protein